MIDEPGNLGSLETDTPLTPPRFDISSKAEARPVEPIPNARRQNLNNRLSSFRRLVKTQMGVLAVVVILGLATGALGGIMLAGRNVQLVDTSLEASGQVSEFPNTADTQKLDAFAAKLNGATGLTAAAPAVRVRKSRAQGRTIGQPRAYRVAVIRE